MNLSTLVPHIAISLLALPVGLILGLSAALWVRIGNLFAVSVLMLSLTVFALLCLIFLGVDSSYLKAGDPTGKTFTLIWDSTRTLMLAALVPIFGGFIVLVRKARTAIQRKWAACIMILVVFAPAGILGILECLE